MTSPSALLQELVRAQLNKAALGSQLNCCITEAKLEEMVWWDQSGWNITRYCSVTGIDIPWLLEWSPQLRGSVGQHGQL